VLCNDFKTFGRLLDEPEGVGFFAGRVAASPTSTHTAQLIGGAISPSLFTSQAGTPQQPLVMANYPVAQNLMIGDYVKPGNAIVSAVFRQ